MKKAFVRHLLFKLLTLLSICFGGFVVTMGLLILKLANDPINLNSYQSYIEPFVNSTFPGARLETPALELKWDKSDFTYFVEAKSAKFISSDDAQEVEIPYLSFRFPILRLLMLQFKPETVSIQGVGMKLDLAKLESGGDDADNSSFVDYLISYFSESI